jgi:hypothetical protein
MCRSCYEEIKQSGVWWCFGLECFRDREIDNEILLLEVNCYNHSRGCLWQGDLKNLKEHFDECGKKLNWKFQRCSNEGCGELIPSSEIRYHNRKTCPHRIMSCKHCKKKAPANELQDHVLGCDYRPQPCSNDGCGNSIPKAGKKNHERNTCPYRLVSCEYCQWKIVVKDLTAHYTLCAKQLSTTSILEQSKQSSVDTGIAWNLPQQGRETVFHFRPNEECKRLVPESEINYHEKETCIYRAQAHCEVDFTEYSLVPSNLDSHHESCHCVECKSLLVRKRKFGTYRGELNIQQTNSVLFLSRPLLKAQRKLRAKLLERNKLFATQEALPGELLRVNNEIWALSNQLNRHLRPLERKLDVFWFMKLDVGGYRNDCARLSQTIECLNRKLFDEAQRKALPETGRPCYCTICTKLEDLEESIRGHVSELRENALPSSLPRWSGCKRQRVCSPSCTETNESLLGEPLAHTPSSWAHRVRLIETRVEKLETEKQRNEKRVENLEIENMQLQSRILELELRQQTHFADSKGEGSADDPVITRTVYQNCITDICEWIDVDAMQSQLMKHSVIHTPDDIGRLENCSPNQKRRFLYCKLCSIKNGFQLLYRCLRESQHTHIGHKDAADVLERAARRVSTYMEREP